MSAEISAEIWQKWCRKLSPPNLISAEIYPVLGIQCCEGNPDRNLKSRDRESRPEKSRDSGKIGNGNVH